MKGTLEVLGCVFTIGTRVFESLKFDNAELRAARIIELPYVENVDWVHGTIEVACDPENLPAVLADLKKHLTARRARGERIVRGMNSLWEETTTYEPGEYSIGDTQ